jgi:hypothetical protein
VLEALGSVIQARKLKTRWAVYEPQAQVFCAVASFDTVT